MNRSIQRRDMALAGREPIGASRLLQALHTYRGAACGEQYRLGGLLTTDALPGVQRACEILAQALGAQQKVLIVGDYDADGATSCALAVRALRRFGFQRVNYLVSNRFAHGYGLSPGLARVIIAEPPSLVITVDNGISSVAGVASLRQAGIDVIVTDHHLPGSELPFANAIVNPKLDGSNFQSTNLAGVGVMFYVLIAFRAHLQSLGYSSSDLPNLAQYLDLVALGTVADVVELDRNNRILVEQGLRRLRKLQANPGILQLFAVSGRDVQQATAADLGFAIGPRINAAGRLEDMSVGVECLLSDNPVQARALALELDAMNRERRLLQADMERAAYTAFAHLQAKLDAVPYGICLYRDDWHEGIVGLLAARIREHTGRPVIVFARAEAGLLKGSARSISNLHIRDVLAQIAVAQPDLISSFGGHAMAAGLSIALTNLERFAEAFEATVKLALGSQAPRTIMYSDGSLHIDDHTLEVASALQFGGPWGKGFEPPQFDAYWRIADLRTLAGSHLRIMFVDANNAQSLPSAIWFRGAGQLELRRGQIVRVLYRLELNHYDGHTRPQLLVEHIEHCPLAQQQGTAALVST